MKSLTLISVFLLIITFLPHHHLKISDYFEKIHTILTAPLVCQENLPSHNSFLQKADQALAWIDDITRCGFDMQRWRHLLTRFKTLPRKFLKKNTEKSLFYAQKIVQFHKASFSSSSARTTLPNILTGLTPLIDTEVNHILFFFYISVGCLEEAKNQINILDTESSNKIRYYLELSRYYLDYAFRIIEKRTEGLSSKNLSERITTADTNAHGYMVILKNLSVIASYYYPSGKFHIPSQNGILKLDKLYIEDILLRATIDKEPAIVESAITALQNLSSLKILTPPYLYFNFQQTKDRAHDYMMLGYYAVSQGRTDIASTLFKRAQSAYHLQMLPFMSPAHVNYTSPYEEMMKALGNMLSQLNIILDKGMEKKDISLQHFPSYTQKILIVGGSGFLGRRVISVLQKTYPHALLVIADINPPDFIESLDSTKASHPVDLYPQERQEIQTAFDQGRIQYQHIDIRDMTQVTQLFSDYEGFHQVVHLAAMKLVPWSREHPLGTITTNMPLGLYVSCAQYGSRLIQMSSAEVYKRKEDIEPFREKDLLDPSNNPYAASKFLAEHIAKLLKIPTTSIRMANLYGPGQGNGIVSEFTRSLWKGDTIQLRDNASVELLYVNVSAHMIQLLLHDPSLLGTYNFAPPFGLIGVHDAALLIKEALTTSSSARTLGLVGQRPEKTPLIKTLDSSLLFDSLPELASAARSICSKEHIPSVIPEEIQNQPYYERQEKTPIPRQKIKPQRETLLSTYENTLLASTFDSLTGKTFLVKNEPVSLVRLLPHLPGRFYQLDTQGWYVTSGPCVIPHQTFAYSEGEVMVLENVCYSMQHNLTFWKVISPQQPAASLNVEEKDGYLKLSSLMLDRTYISLGDWIYLGDTPLGEIKNIPALDGYWVHKTTFVLCPNELRTYFLLEKYDLATLSVAPHTDTLTCITKTTEALKQAV